MILIACAIRFDCNQYGEEVGLYFAFLATYTKSLTPIAALGASVPSPRRALFTVLLDRHRAYGRRSSRNIGRCVNASSPFDGVRMEVLVSGSPKRQPTHTSDLLVVERGPWKDVTSERLNVDPAWDLCASWSSSSWSYSSWKPFWRYYTKVLEVSSRYARSFTFMFLYGRADAIAARRPGAAIRRECPNSA
jgi:hypothetical protein